jgi:hypothetical protein
VAYLWSYLLIALAAMFKALADAFENTPNFDESIFRNFDKKFWCKDVSWYYAKKIYFKIPFIKKPIDTYKIDSWHLCITIMVCCIAGAVVVYKPHHEWWVHYVSIGTIWNVVFVLFYHGVFKVK